MSTSTPWTRNKHRANEMCRYELPGGRVILVRAVWLPPDGNDSAGDRAGIHSQAHGVFVGFWRSEAAPTLPAPHDFVDDTWDLQERRRVADYLDYGKVVGDCGILATCCICGQRNGSQELSDGVFVWPEGLGHYVREHAVRLPQAFIERVLREERTPS